MKNSITKTLLPAIAAIFVLFSVGCQKAEEPKPANTSSPAPAADTSAVKVEIKTDPDFIEAGKDVELAFTIKDGKDQIIKDLKITHEQPLHLIAISQDLTEFFHLHPKPVSDGTYRVRHTFPSGGRYTLFLDMTLPDGKQNVQIIGLAAVGKERPKTDLKADAKLIQSVDGLKVEMVPDAELAAGKSATLNFKVADAATNKPVMDLEKYLGEDAHFVIVSQDLKEFVHAHPMSGDDPNSGHEHGARSNSAISAHVTFPKGGLYKIWAQFQRAGKVITVPFVVSVKAAEGEIDHSKVEIPPGAIKVTVSKEGYTPVAIEVKAGKPVTLAFIRIDNENCGNELIFHTLNIKKELPLGKVVTVEIPAEKPGEFAFACGMDMLKGIVMVE